MKEFFSGFSFLGVQSSFFVELMSNILTIEYVRCRLWTFIVREWFYPNLWSF